jgi:polysaccharide biosynthesis/export protein
MPVASAIHRLAAKAVPPVLHPVLLLALLLGLTACNAPRGAGLESEVLAAQADAEATGVPADFAVYAVTRGSLGLIAGWPSVGLGGGDWIRRQEQPASLLIAPGDLVTVTVWDAQANSILATPGQRVTEMRDMRVSSSGEIFLPFVGDLRIAGMSAQSARERVEERYSDTIPAVQVQLDVTPGRANTANLVAGVASPGVYPLEDRDVTILTLLAMGGGVSPNLNNPQVRLFRGGDVYATALDRLYDDPGLDTTLQGGDRVIVEADERYFLSLGAAGTEAVHPFPQDLVTAIDALSIIGGVSEARADPKAVLILREYPARATRADPAEGPPQTRIVFTVDLTTADGLFSAGNFRIMPGDLVYATESPLPATGSILQIFGSVLGLAERVTGN